MSNNDNHHAIVCSSELIQQLIDQGSCYLRSEPVSVEADEKPFYVNAKQYNRILHRREQRARLQQMGVMVRTGKQYKHESRHKHAMKRARTNHGRFGATGNGDQPLTKLKPERQPTKWQPIAVPIPSKCSTVSVDTTLIPTTSVSTIPTMAETLGGNTMSSDLLFGTSPSPSLKTRPLFDDDKTSDDTLLGGGFSAFTSSIDFMCRSPTNTNGNNSVSAFQSAFSIPSTHSPSQ